MSRQGGAGSGQRFALGSLPAVAIARARTPVTAETPRSVLRLRLAALLAAQLFDFGTFTVMVARHGIRAEVNPIIAHGFTNFGLPLLAAGKLAQVVLVGSILVILGRSWGSGSTSRWLGTSVALVAVAGGLIGGISNFLVL